MELSLVPRKGSRHVFPIQKQVFKQTEPEYWDWDWVLCFWNAAKFVRTNQKSFVVIYQLLPKKAKMTLGWENLRVMRFCLPEQRWKHYSSVVVGGGWATCCHSLDEIGFKVSRAYARSEPNIINHRLLAILKSMNRWSAASLKLWICMNSFDKVPADGERWPRHNVQRRAGTMAPNQVPKQPNLHRHCQTLSLGLQQSLSMQRLKKAYCKEREWCGCGVEEQPFNRALSLVCLRMFESRHLSETPGLFWALFRESWNRGK